MTALTTNRYTKHRDGLVTAHPVKAAAHIFKGSLVCADSSGFAVPAADTAGYVLLGVAIEEANNTGASGALSVRVQTKGVFSFEKSGALTQANVGQALCVFDDQTVALSSVTANDIPVGKLEALDGVSAAWVRI